MLLRRRVDIGQAAGSAAPAPHSKPNAGAMCGMSYPVRLNRNRTTSPGALSSNVNAASWS